jgi:D-arabinose 1-dehydrogenase-like Zn-dependent alcohol dehydrogenase
VLASRWLSSAWAASDTWRETGHGIGAEVTVFTTSQNKFDDARRFGAKTVILNQDGADFSKFKHAFDFALDGSLQP